MSYVSGEGRFVKVWLIYILVRVFLNMSYLFVVEVFVCVGCVE